MPHAATRKAAGSIVVTLAVIATLAACADKAIAPPDDNYPPVPGCYQLTLGQWQGPRRDSWNPALHFELSSERREDQLWAGETIVKPTTVGGELHYPWAIWRQPRADSLVVNFSTGYVGTVLLFSRVDADRWTGRAQAWTDTPTPMPSASATLERASCTE